MSHGALSLSASDLNKELKYLVSVLKGKASLAPKITSKSDYNSLVPLENFLASEPSKLSLDGMTSAMKVRSTYRDIPYALAGRRYILTNGINRKILSIKHRMS